MKNQRGFLLNPFRFGAPGPLLPTVDIRFDSSGIASDVYFHTVSSQSGIAAATYAPAATGYEAVCSSAKVKIANSTDFVCGTGNFTYLWEDLYLTSLPATAYVLCDNRITGGGGDTGLVVGVNSTGNVFFYSDGVFYLTTSTAIATTTRTSVQIERKAGVLYSYFNGAAGGSAACTQNLDRQELLLFEQFTAGTNSLYGNIPRFAFWNGTALLS